MLLVVRGRMSVTSRVLLDPARMPLPVEWARAIRAHGFAMDLEVDFDPKTMSGFLPCTHGGHPSGFEYSFRADAELEAEVRLAAGVQRTLEISFVTHSDMRELVSSMIASAVLASMSDGIVWSDESSEVFSGSDAIEIARETERAELPAE
jgi:hypothetical protein